MANLPIYMLINERELPNAVTVVSNSMAYESYEKIFNIFRFLLFVLVNIVLSLRVANPSPVLMVDPVVHAVLKTA